MADVPADDTQRLSGRILARLARLSAAERAELDELVARERADVPAPVPAPGAPARGERG